jgi:hypothetical protein
MIIGGAMACGSSDSARAGDTAFARRDVRITLERTPCKGNCPVYHIELDGTGKVVYDGKGFVDAKGRQEATVPAAEVQALARELEAAGYLGWRDEYPLDATDHASVITSLTIDGKTKRVEHNLSSRTAPSQLEPLERKIDDVARSVRWVGANRSTGAPSKNAAPDTGQPRR